LSRIRLIGGIPNLHPSLLHKGCKLHVSVRVARFVPQENDGYGRSPSSKGRPQREAEVPEATGAEVVLMQPVFKQLEVAYNNDQTALPFYQVDPEAEAPGAAPTPVGSSKTSIDLDLSSYDIKLRGDCVVEVHSEELLVMAISLHTAFVTNDGYLQFDKAAVDLACEDTTNKIYSRDTKVEMFLTAVDDVPQLNVLNQDY
jgi:hypothetical protein